ncbi:MAG: transglutaminase domain-containing protein [Candidatus Aenigmarchaeota archaeon]|nr:transglutaminase domain-containing protein [Candidatus Aenigmarchaeota archaeon]
MRKLIVAVIIVSFLIPLAQARIQAQGEVNPKTVSEITVNIIQQGSLEITGAVERANLTLFIPQEGVTFQGIDADGDSAHEYIYDQYGNKKVLIKWNKPSGTVNYRITTTVKNTAKKFMPTISVGTNPDPSFLQPTKSIVINDEIRKFAFPYDKSWQRVADMTTDVYKLLEYDISMVGQRKSSDWVFENKRGVCVEHANLLTAMLRAAGMPTRYVTGYAYSVVDDRLIGHTWVEVLGSDGSWVSFDPTWLEGGYLDATHIKTASLPDDAQEDVLTYFGTGTVKWKRGALNSEYAGSATGDLYSDTINIIDFKQTDVTTFNIQNSDVVPFDGAAYVKAAVFSDSCLISNVKVSACVDASKNPVFRISDPEQIIFSCKEDSSRSSEVVWFLQESSKQNQPYNCPITIYDQLGSERTVQIGVEGHEQQKNIFISGPDIVGVNERFTIRSSENSNFIFYSPALGTHDFPEWDLAINKPGNYNFSLWAGNTLATKTISVVEKKEFEISIDAPKNATVNAPMIISVNVKNLLDAKSLTVKLDFEGQTYEKFISLGQNEQKAVFYNITASASGQKQIAASAIGNSIATTSRIIQIYDPAAESKNPFQFIIDFFSAIANFFGSLF